MRTKSTGSSSSRTQRRQAHRLVMSRDIQTLIAVLNGDTEPRLAAWADVTAALREDANWLQQRPTKVPPLAAEMMDIINGTAVPHTRFLPPYDIPLAVFQDSTALAAFLAARRGLVELAETGARKLATCECCEKLFLSPRRSRRTCSDRCRQQRARRQCARDGRAA